jgi:hypothetical protein
MTKSKMTKAYLLAGPIVYVMARRLPKGHVARMPLMLFGGSAAILAAFKTYCKD